MGFWKRKKIRAVVREADVKHARAELENATQEWADAVKRAPLVADLATTAVIRREQNHFGDALTLSFTPRSHHA